jgi:class 3 adenylate cyclase/dihydrofolate reductase
VPPLDETLTCSIIDPIPPVGIAEEGRSMRRIVVAEFVTLDGVIEAPGHEEHRDGRNAWALNVTSEDMVAYGFEQLQGVDALLLGRATYQIWAAFWPFAAPDAIGERINDLPKYVVSTTLTEVTWNNSIILTGQVVSEVSKLKAGLGGDILVSGSADLVDLLMRNHLVDELRLMMYPVVLGSGKRLFRDQPDTTHLRLVESRTFESGVVLLRYQPAAEAPSSEYSDAYAWSQEQIKSLQAAQNADRVLASILFTDIVDSTGRATALGDRGWRQLLDHHDRIAREQVDRFRGRLVKTTGDGILATFDTPTRAIRCAFELVDGLAGSGLTIRAGIHTGEIQLLEGDVAGIGVHIASRVLGKAGDDQIVVTRTVRDLATGTDLVFTPLGSVNLRGVPNEWELFRVSVG